MTSNNLWQDEVFSSNVKWDMRKKFFGRQVIDDGSNGIIRQLWQNNMDVTEKKILKFKANIDWKIYFLIAW